MNKFISLLFIYCGVLFPPVTVQDNPAVSVLDRFASQTKAAPSVSMQFRLITSDLPENRKDTLNGSIIIAGDRYRLTLPESTTWFNGTDTWNYMPSVNEVTITRPRADDISFSARPSLLFDAYRHDFRPRLVEETTSTWAIDLFPDDPKSEIIKVKLTIAKQGLVLKSAEYRTRNGIIIKLDINDFSLKFRPDAKYFDFNPSAHKGVEIIDMR